ncbi:hypothetical protein KM043_005879 [Ampulex compressa]|nr:hypothetical protein KM043_005879 [Ampulex compressa]
MRELIVGNKDEFSSVGKFRDPESSGISNFYRAVIGASCKTSSVSLKSTDSRISPTTSHPCFPTDHPVFVEILENLHPAKTMLRKRATIAQGSPGCTCEKMAIKRPCRTGEGWGRLESTFVVNTKAKEMPIILPGGGAWKVPAKRG